MNNISKYKITLTSRQALYINDFVDNPIITEIFNDHIKIKDDEMFEWFRRHNHSFGINKVWSYDMNGELVVYRPTYYISFDTEEIAIDFKMRFL